MPPLHPTPTHSSCRLLASKAAQALFLLRTLTAANVNRLVLRLANDTRKKLQDLVRLGPAGTVAWASFGGWGRGGAEAGVRDVFSVCGGLWGGGAVSLSPGVLQFLHTAAQVLM